MIVRGIFSCDNYAVNAIEMVHTAIERSRYYEMLSDWNEDALKYMIENWDSISL